jgi:VanZ family protein
MKWLAILFTVFILLIIVLANAGILSHYLILLHKFPFGDKLGHFLLYGILALLINLSLFRSRPLQDRRWIAVRLGLILALLIGLEEFSQQFFSKRSFDLVDLAFSYLGVASFSWLAVLTKK